MRPNNFYKFLLISLFICSFEVSFFAQSVIPFPYKQSAALYKLNVKSLNYIYTKNDELNDEIKIFNEFLKNAGMPLMQISKKDTGTVILILDETMHDEAYTMTVKEKNLVISGKKNGIFYGLMTLLQWKSQDEKGYMLIRNNIVDEPAFTWRGMHLDVSRHFFPTGFIKKYIDILAMHKMNTFHWHLTDDQGWRIEIKKYPLLTEIGSKREETMVAKNFDPYLGDRTPVQGYYTQEQIADIVKYAALRHVTIIPEIEMPGHAQAALCAYPEYSCNKEKMPVWTQWGVSEQVFCSDEKTIDFLKDILDEVIALFPSQYIHIGGDEVPKERWKKCDVCQRNMKRNRLKDEHALQSYFINQIDEYVVSKGRNIIGWDEILEGGLAANAAVMSWRGVDGGIAAARMKHYVVMSPGSHCYFDHYQSKSKEEPLAIGGYTSLEKVYSYFPIPEQLKSNEEKYILGAQGNVWTEYIPISSHVEYMAVPRICALAEVLWSGKNKPGYDNFKNRLQKHFLLLKAYQINYSNAVYDVDYNTEIIGDTIKLSMKAPFYNGKIYYTTDGSNPDMNKKIYEKPIYISVNDIVKMRYYEKNEAKGNIVEVKTEKK